VEDEIELARLELEDLRFLDAEVIRVGHDAWDLLGVDEPERAVGLDDRTLRPPDVTPVMQHARPQAAGDEPLGAAEALVPLETDLVDDVARPLLDEELDLHLSQVRREDDAPANAGIEETALPVITLDAGDILLHAPRVVLAVTAEEAKGPVD